MSSISFQVRQKNFEFNPEVATEYCLHEKRQGKQHEEVECRKKDIDARIGCICSTDERHRFEFSQVRWNETDSNSKVTTRYCFYAKDFSRDGHIQRFWKVIGLHAFHVHQRNNPLLVTLLSSCLTLVHMVAV